MEQNLTGGLYLRRAVSELDSARILFDVPIETRRRLDISLDATFYSSVIAHSYYAIFYCAKAMLLSRGIRTDAPEIHKKTYDAFKREFIDTGVLDCSLLLIYKEMVIRAETLLEICRIEKGKRGRFTYNTIPQANKGPAEESIRNATVFIRNCDAYLIR
jgi:uncharacterized protein (UPF0332 family)